MAQAGPGKIVIFEDFCGADVPVALTTAVENIGPFQLVGQGIAENDSGAIILDSDGLSGVIQLTTTDEDAHSIGLVTATMFDVALMAPLVLEARVRFAAVNTGEFFFGLSDVATDTQILEGGLVHGNSVTITNTASDFAGFLLSSELTDSADWHMVYNGGSAAAVTVSTSLDADDVAVLGEFDVLRLEVDPNGTARWYIDGVLKQTVVGAVSTTVDMGVVCMVESKTTACKTADVDYILIRANRDWTK